MRSRIAQGVSQPKPNIHPVPSSSRSCLRFEKRVSASKLEDKFVYKNLADLLDVTFDSSDELQTECIYGLLAYSYYMFIQFL